MVVEDYDMPSCDECSSFNCKVICESCANRRVNEFAERIGNELRNLSSKDYDMDITEILKVIKEELMGSKWGTK